MSNTQLQQYVRDAQSRGIGDEEIKQELIKAGWGSHDIDDVFAPKAPLAPRLAPPPPPQLGMWVTFQYAVCFVCLYIVAVALGSIADTMLDKWVPNPASPSCGLYGGSCNSFQIQFQLAALIVAAPIFVILFMVLRRQIAKNPGIRSLAVRKKAIYVTLFIAAVVVIIDLIWNIYDMLSGNVSMNGIGHLVVVLVIAGSIFFYLLRDVKEDRTYLSA